MDFSLSDLLTGVSQIAKTGTEAYSAVVGTQTDKLKEKSAIEQAKPAAVAPTATAVAATPAAKPWYKAAWVIPAAIGAVILLVIFFVMGRRKR